MGKGCSSHCLLLIRKRFPKYEKHYPQHNVSFMQASVIAMELWSNATTEAMTRTNLQNNGSKDFSWLDVKYLLIWLRDGLVPYPESDYV